LSKRYVEHDGGYFLLYETRADSWQAMHAGVVRDMEQQRVKKERQLDFEMQKTLEEEYKKEQRVQSSTEPGAGIDNR
jgi:protein PET117